MDLDERARARTVLLGVGATDDGAADERRDILSGSRGNERDRQGEEEERTHHGSHGSMWRHTGASNVRNRGVSGYTVPDTGGRVTTGGRATGIEAR